MDRIQKKCFVGVAVMHALLLLIAVIGTAFFNKEEKVTESPHIIELVNPIVTDGPTRGGAPAAAAPIQAVPDVKREVAQPVQPRPAPPEPVRKPEPKPEREPVVEQPKPKVVERKEEVSELPVPKKRTLPKKVSRPEPKVAAKPRPERKIDISKPIIRHSNDDRASAEAAQRAAEQRARSRAAAALSSSLARLGKNLSSSTTIDLEGGSGDAGAVNYGDLVLKKYDDAWIAPNEVDDNEAVVKAKVVIGRSGNVISATIIKASGNAVLDKSVRRALELRFIHPFPEGSKDSQRTYIINFNLKAKRGIG